MRLGRQEPGRGLPPAEFRQGAVPAEPKAQAAIDADPAVVGKYYRETIRLTRAALADVKELVPGSDGARASWPGFGWHQGWNDRIDDKFNAEYEKNLANFIRDVRKDLDAPNLPFVDRRDGHERPGGETPPRPVADEGPGGRGRVPGVQGERGVRRRRRRSGGRRTSRRRTRAYHWNTNAETYWLIGGPWARR